MLELKVTKTLRKAHEGGDDVPSQQDQVSTINDNESYLLMP